MKLHFLESTWAVQHAAKSVYLTCFVSCQLAAYSTCSVNKQLGSIALLCGAEVAAVMCHVCYVVDPTDIGMRLEPNLLTSASTT